MKYYCPRCFTRLFISHWRKVQRGRLTYTVVTLCCPCCPFTMRDYDMPGDAQPDVARDAQGKPLPGTSLLERLDRLDAKLAQKQVKS